MKRRRRGLDLIDIKTREADLDIAALRSHARTMDWYVLTTEAQKEFHASLILRRHGFTTFLPTRQDYRRRNRYVRQKDLLPYALIPRCLLVGFRIESVPPWLNLFRFSLVTGVIGFDGAPRTLPQHSVIDLVDRYGANHFRAPDCQKFMRTHAEFRVGDLVRVAEGSLEGYELRVEKISEDQADFLVDLFGRTHAMRIPLDHLEPIR